MCALIGVGITACLFVITDHYTSTRGMMEGTEQSAYGLAVGLVTRAAQCEMIQPALIPIVITLIVGLVSVEALGGLLIVVGLFVAVAMTSGGAAWDNGKKLIELGVLGGAGSILGGESRGRSTRQPACLHACSGPMSRLNDQTPAGTAHQFVGGVYGHELLAGTGGGGRSGCRMPSVVAVGYGGSARVVRGVCEGAPVEVFAVARR